MGVYTYLLNKSKPWTLPGIGKLYNLKYSHRSSDEDVDKWHWDDTEGKRWSALCLARNGRSLENTFPTEYVYFALSLEYAREGDIIKVYRGRVDNKDLRVWYDCDRIHGEWVGTVEVLNLKPRKKLRYLPISPKENTCES
jgi:hypothetical protein